MSAPTLAYFADLLIDEDGDTCSDGRWLSADERAALIGDTSVIVATFVPLFAAADDAHAIAWLVAGVDPGPYVTGSRAGAMAALDIGATVTGLQFAQPDKT
jgi:hypothetical protein